MKKEIVIASGNKGKIKEFSFLFAQHNIEAKSMLDFPNAEEPEENGLTFFENALIKSKSLRQHTELPIIADDSGLCIDILDQQPGIYSARWMKKGSEKSVEIGIAKIQEEILNKLPECKDLNNKEFSARFVCSLALLLPNNEYKEFTGKLEGKIIFPPRGEEGFGYDSIFIPENSDKTLAEIDFQIKQQMSHRTEAFVKVIDYISKNLC